MSCVNHTWSNGVAPRTEGPTRCSVCGVAPTAVQIEHEIRMMASEWIGLTRRQAAVLYAAADMLRSDYRRGYADGLKMAIDVIEVSETHRGSNEQTRAIRTALESVVPEGHRNPGSGRYLQIGEPSGSLPTRPATSTVPDWMEASVADYGAAVERLVLAFIRKHGERPKLFTDDRPDLGQMAAFCHPRFVADDGEGVHPKLAELAAAHADEWHERYGDLDPDEAIAYMIASPGEVRVRVERRTPEVEEALAKRSEYVRTLLSAARNPGH